MRFKPRGRFDLMFVFDDGASLRITSQKTRSLSAQEVVTRLREHCDHVEQGLAAGRAARGDTGHSDEPRRPRRGQRRED